MILRRFTSAALLTVAAVTVANLSGAETPVSRVVVAYPASPFLDAARDESVTIELRGIFGGQGHYFLETTQLQRDQSPSERLVLEQPGWPRVRSGNLAFDALFALALEDMRLDSVSEIRDDAYNNGEAIRRDVFQTGEKWHYVWTRDVSYAIDLGLGAIDPRRSAETVLFKVSPFREGLETPEGIPEDSLQIIQDTGSGGSWPVSTDRASWAIAADAILDQLSGPACDAFAKRAYAALRGTLAADRLAAYDPDTGLYGGEQSFLDWRIQTYAPWITDNLSWMSASKALSTNVCHHRALSLAVRLAEERGETTRAAQYRHWASELAEAIHTHFWIPEAGLYSSLTSPSGRPEYRFDLLGNALVILSGIASQERAFEILSRYPHGPMGASVCFPQQPDVYVYHNRAIWPFVTAYGLAAAHRTHHVAAAEAAVETLMRSAALNLSNMENFEWLTGLPHFDDGPAINSRRQLWSVAGYLGMVVHSFFGYTPTPEGITFDPFLTAGMRNRLGSGITASLDGLDYQGASLRVRLALPPSAKASGFFPLQSITLNGEAIEKPIKREQLRSFGENEVVLSFGPLQSTGATITEVSKVDPLARRDSAVFAPECPQVRIVEHHEQRFLEVVDAVNDPADTRYEVFRDNGSLGWMESPGRWTTAIPDSDLSHDFAVVAAFRSSGHRSHSSRPLRMDGRGFQFISSDDPRVRAVSGSGKGIESTGSPHLENWGAPDDRLLFTQIEIPAAGRYAFRLRYHNDAHTIDSGVTCGVKRAQLTETRSEETWDGVLQMPNVDVREGIHRWVESTALVVELSPGCYRLELSDFFNMSYLEANASYRYKGGRTGAYNRFKVKGLCVIPLPPAY